MPIRNEETFIARSLGAVLNQTYPAECTEILIADGMSDDHTLDVIRSLPSAEHVRIIPNPRRIQAAGLNEAIQHAQGAYIIRIDGHTVIAPDYVEQCIRILQETGVQNVGGAMDPVGITPIGKAIAAAGKSPFAVPSAFHVSRQAQYTDTVYLGAWPRQVFAQVGLYNEHVGVNEDYELNYRIRKAGGKIYFSPMIRSQYYGRQTLRALARQYFRYGVSKVKTLREHPASLRPRQIVAPAFVVWLLVGIPLILLDSPLAWLWLGGLLLYGVLNLFFSVRVAARSGWSLLLWLPLIFLAIHISWGTGFWRGILKAG
jgi:glycosyltransferase involved in cell wall biosynthesis